MASDGKARDPKTGHWLKGQSGNPAGGPRKELSLTAAIRRLGYECKADDDRPRNERLAEVLWDMALERDIHAAREVLERCDGKVAVRIASDPDAPTGITFLVETKRIAEHKDDGDDGDSTDQGVGLAGRTSRLPE